MSGKVVKRRRVVQLFLLQECTGSICLAYGLESCQCIPGPSDPPTKACELCCRLPGENQPCLYVTSCLFIYYETRLMSNRMLIAVLAIGRPSSGTPHRTTSRICSRNREHRVMITMDTVMSSKNVEKCVETFNLL